MCWARAHGTSVRYDVRYEARNQPERHQHKSQAMVYTFKRFAYKFMHFAMAGFLIVVVVAKQSKTFIGLSRSPIRQRYPSKTFTVLVIPIRYLRGQHRFFGHPAANLQGRAADRAKQRVSHN